MVDRLIGASVDRVEDPRLLTGQGRFVDDVSFPGMLHASFLRSIHPHARIRRIDTSRAVALAGVVAVLTGDDMRALCHPFQQIGPPQLRTPQFYALAVDKARFVGDPLALVVAESRYLAEDACDLIDVDFDVLEPVADADQAIAEASPLLYDELGDNVVYQDSWQYGDVAGAFAQADRVIMETFRQHRYAGVPMETRGGVATYLSSTGQLSYYVSHKAPHSLRLQLSRLLDQPEHRTNVVCGDVGGAFGQKGQTGREDIAVCAAAKLLGRPGKWIADRSGEL